MREKLSIKAKRDIVASLKNKYKVKALCEIPHIKHDAYYYKPHPKATLAEQIKAVKLSFYGGGRVYGQEKISEELRQEGTPISKKTVAKIMKKEGLEGNM